VFTNYGSTTFAEEAFMEVVHAHEHPVGVPVRSIFLAGPSPRGNEEYNWRPEALSILEHNEFSGTVYVPLPRSGEYRADYDHVAQIDWELFYLENAHVIAFWIPRDIQTLPGFTTNVEFGLFAASTKALLGYPPGAHKMRYLHRVAEMYGIEIFNHLAPMLLTAIWRENVRVKREGTEF
jgi:hypothetical protein